MKASNMTIGCVLASSYINYYYQGVCGIVKPYQLAVAGMCSYHQWLGGIEESDHICVHKH